MGIISTLSNISTFRLLLVLGFALGLSACEIDDRVLCDDNEVSQDETPHCPQEDSEAQSFKVQYTTANGTRPDGRYGFTPSGSATTDDLAEAEAWLTIQYVLDTSPVYVNFEANEILHYRGNICGPGFTLRKGLGDFRVIGVRRTGATTFDYDIELTCID